MQPLTVDANRPKGRFCILGGRMVHVWFSDCPSTVELDGRLQLRSIMAASGHLSECGIPIGPLWTDQPQGNSVCNRSTVVRFTFKSVPVPSARDSIGSQQYQCCFPTPCISNPVLAHCARVSVGVTTKETKILM